MSASIQAFCAAQRDRRSRYSRLPLALVMSSLCAGGIAELIGKPAYAYSRQLIEAETSYSAGNDVGSYAVSPQTGSSLASGKFLSLYDRGDTAILTFRVDQAGAYDLGVRLRSGYRNWPVSHWQDGYEFMLDGKAVSLLPDNESISGLDPISSGSHWGVMRIDGVSLQPGQHTLAIKTLKKWSLLDYLEIGYSGDITPPADASPNAVISHSALTGTLPLEVTFSADGSTDDIGIVSYQWDFGNGDSQSAEAAVASYTEAGEYLATLTVTDGSGQTSVDKVTVTVESPQLVVDPPLDTGKTLFEAEDDYSAHKDPGQYAISGYDAQLSSNQYLSLYDAGDTARVRFYVDSEGKYDLGVRVRSGYKNWPTSHWQGGYEFAVDGVGMTFEPDASSLSALDPVSSGSYWGTMRLKDVYLAAGYHHLDVKTIKKWSLLDYIEVSGQQTGTGLDQAPVAVINAGSLSGVAPLDLSFDGYASTDDTGIDSYAWDFGDGAVATGAAASHLYEKAGDYTLKLRVTDTAGQSHSTSVTVAVAEEDDGGSVVTQSLQLQSEPIVINARKHVVLENLHFTGSAFRNKGRPAITIQGDASHITVRNCLFDNVDWAIRIQGGSNIEITGNRFEKVGMGIRADDVKGGLVVNYNEATHIGAWDITPYFPGFWGQTFMQAVNSSGAGNSISYNVLDNQGVASKHLEDMTNLWNAGGTADSYFQIVGNRYRGSSLAGNVSKTGGGIIVGDGSAGSGAKGWYVDVRDNIMVRTQSYGVGGAGGFHLNFINNKVHMPAEHTKIMTRHPYHHDQNGGGTGIVFTQYSGNACGNIRFEDNDAHAIGWNGSFTSSWPQPKVITPKCSNETFVNNSWRNTPGPIGDDLLPADMFSALGSEYFSANH